MSRARPPKPRGPQTEFEFSAACSTARRQEVEDVVAWWNSGSASYTLHTSGSTGAPKELMLQRAHIEASALATIAFFGLSEGQRSPLLMSAKTVGGFMMVVRALMAGLKLDILSVERRPATRPGLRYDFVALVPEQAAALAVDPQFDPTDFHCTLLGGADVRPELDEVLSKWPRPVYHGYGMPTATPSRPLAASITSGKIFLPALTTTPSRRPSHSNSLFESTLAATVVTKS